MKTKIVVAIAASIYIIAVFVHGFINWLKKLL